MLHRHILELESARRQAPEYPKWNMVRMEEKTAGEGMHQIIIDGNAFYEIDEDCVRRKQEKAAAAQQRIENREQGKKNMGQQTDLMKNGKEQCL